MDTMTAHTHRCIAAAGSAALLLAGCPIPIPPGYDSYSRENVAATAPATIQAGLTTREDVLMLLGEPDVVAIDESWMAYASIYISGGLVVIAGAGGGAAALGTTYTRYRRLIIAFDPQGVTTDVVLESRRCFLFAAADLFGNNPNNQGLATKPCLDATGHDIPEKRHLPSIRE